MEQNKNDQPDENEKSDRREALQKLGRFAAYAAPFTVLAMTKKADAATGHGPARHSAKP
jgi:formiminotetrahydrofolate cyclodeaminase